MVAVVRSSVNGDDDVIDEICVFAVVSQYQVKNTPATVNVLQEVTLNTTEFTESIIE
jgi:hypothetical protein